MEELADSTDVLHIDTLLDRAQEQMHAATDEAISFLEQVFALAEKQNYTRGKTFALNMLAWKGYLKGDFQTMLLKAQTALPLAQSIGDKNQQAGALIHIGNAYYQMGEYADALENLIHSIELCKETGNKRMMGAAMTNIGHVYEVTADYARALEYYMNALALLEEINLPVGIAASLGNIGRIYIDTHNYSKALETFKRSLSISEEIGDKLGTAKTFCSIANTYFHSEEYKISLEYLKRGLELLEEIGDKSTIALALGNFGNTLARTGELDEALQYHMRALAIKLEINDKSGRADTLREIADIYRLTDFKEFSLQRSVEYLRQSLAIAEEIEAKALIYRVNEALADVYEQLEDWKNSQIHFRKYHVLEREVFNKETSGKITNLETQRKFVEIEKERELERREQKATFKILNRVLPRQIVDRVKNGEENIADKFLSASVLFADIVGFTPLAEKLGADEVLKLLSGIFSHFDMLCEKFGVEKIKTVGDSYMAASGVPVESDNHLLKIAKLAIAMQEDLKLNLDFKIPELSIRIGIHTGEVIAGVLGTQKLSYDIWGDTVNTAARMESHGEPDMIHVTEDVFKALKDKYVFKERGEMEIKGKGRMKTYFLLKEKN
ncbi:MAG: adenylate/guanylate cyclase domain-containing protein [Bacteroidota bacterium]